MIRVLAGPERSIKSVAARTNVLAKTNNLARNNVLERNNVQRDRAFPLGGRLVLVKKSKA